MINSSGKDSRNTYAREYRRTHTKAAKGLMVRKCAKCGEEFKAKTTGIYCILHKAINRK